MRSMTSERSQAYGRVMRTLAELGPSKLLPSEQDRLRDAADALLFSEDPRDDATLDAMADARALAAHLVGAGRWSESRAAELADDLTGCGPAVLVG
jgi:hypothetical protein